MQYVNFNSVDWEGPMSNGISGDDTSIPQIHTEHEAEVLQILLSQVDPLQNSDVFSIDIYVDVVKVNDFLHVLGTSWSSTWHLVCLIFEPISPISNTYCAIKNAS